MIDSLSLWAGRGTKMRVWEQERHVMGLKMGILNDNIVTTGKTD